MRYIFIAIIVFVLSTGVLLYVSKSHQNTKNLQQKKSFHASISPTPDVNATHGVRGTITEITKTGFVMRSSDGTKKTVIMTDTTKFLGTDKDSLAVNKEIGVSGKIDTKGILTAQVIEGPAVLNKFHKKTEN